MKVYDCLAYAGYVLRECLNERLSVRSGERRRGVALLLVLTYIAVMSATVVAGFMNSQVNYSIAANVRDELKAYYKARSAMNLGRLLLTFQYELEKDETFGPRLQRSNFQLYQILDLLVTPFKSGVIKVDIPGEKTVASYDLRAAGVAAMGEDSGDYSVRVVPEEGRINLNVFSDARSPTALMQLCMLFSQPRYDVLFNAAGEDAKKLTRNEQIAAMIDWVDKDGDLTIIDDKCAFSDSSGDEMSLYNRTNKTYEVKNAKLTSIDELFEIAGIGDDFMSTFREAFTVYPVDRINVNLATARVMFAPLCEAVKVPALSSNPTQLSLCMMPQISERLMLLAMALEGYQQFVLNPLNLLYLYVVEKQASIIPGVVPSGTVVPFRNNYEFNQVIEAMLKDPALIRKFLLNSPTAYQILGNSIIRLSSEQLALKDISFDEQKLSDAVSTGSPRIFRLVAVGEYADTKKVIQTVMDFNVEGGKFLYWREF